MCMHKQSKGSAYFRQSLTQNVEAALNVHLQSKFNYSGNSVLRGAWDHQNYLVKSVISL